MTDRDAIVDVLHIYAWAIDTREWERLATDVLTADVLADYGLPEPIRSAARAGRVPAALARARPGHPAPDRQLHGTVDGDTARSTCDTHASLVRRHTPGGYQLVVGALRRRAGWRIARRVATMMFRDGNSASYVPEAISPVRPTVQFCGQVPVGGGPVGTHPRTPPSVVEWLDDGRLAQ